MAVIAPTSMQGPGQRTLAETTCTASDTFVYQAGDILLLRNPTGAAVSPKLDGDEGVNWQAEGLGPISVATGYTIGSIAAGSARAIPLDSIRGYLQGTVFLTTGTGLVASILRL